MLKNQGGAIWIESAYMIKVLTSVLKDAKLNPQNAVYLNKQKKEKGNG